MVFGSVYISCDASKPARWIAFTNSLHSPPMSTSRFRLTDTPPQIPLSTTQIYTPFTAYSGSLATPTPGSSQFNSGRKRPYPELEDGDENCVPEIGRPFRVSLPKKKTLYTSPKWPGEIERYVEWDFKLTERDGCWGNFSTKYFEQKIKMATLFTETNLTPDMWHGFCKESRNIPLPLFSKHGTSTQMAEYLKIRYQRNSCIPYHLVLKGSVLRTA